MGVFQRPGKTAVRQRPLPASLRSTSSSNWLLAASEPHPAAIIHPRREFGPASDNPGSPPTIPARDKPFRFRFAPAVGFFDCQKAGPSIHPRRPAASSVSATSASRTAGSFVWAPRFNASNIGSANMRIFFMTSLHGHRRKRAGFNLQMVLRVVPRRARPHKLVSRQNDSAPGSERTVTFWPAISSS